MCLLLHLQLFVRFHSKFKKEKSVDLMLSTMPLKKNRTNDLQGPRRRLLSTSKSTGDLIGMLKKEFNDVPFFPNCDLPPHEKNAGEDLVVCGFLYRLTNTGIWFRLWVELRYNYLMGFYHLTDVFPVDVINLIGYNVRKADECDHLDGLFPIKLSKSGESNLFFFTESEESRMEWMNNFQYSANQLQYSFNIDGLNLEFDSPNSKEITNTRRNSQVIRKIDNKRVEHISVAEDDENEEEKTADTKTSKTCQLVQNIRNKYGMAQTITECEALRLSTYYSQRRLSAQIKVATLQDFEGRPSKSSKSKSSDMIQFKLEELKKRLKEIENKKEKTVCHARRLLVNLEEKRIEELKSVDAKTEKSSQSGETKIKLIKEEVKNVETKVKIAPPKVRISSQTFSPDDKCKTKWFSDVDDVFDQVPSSPKTKLPGPLKILTKAVRPHAKKTKSTSCLSPNLGKSTATKTASGLTSDDGNGGDCDVARELGGSAPQSPTSSSHSNRTLPKFKKRIRRIFSFSGRPSHESKNDSSLPCSNFFT